MSTLIVDFPHRRKSYVVSNCNKNKAVTFSPVCEMKIFESPQVSDPSQLYYTKQDYRAMKAANLRAVRNVYRRYLEMSLSSSRRHIEPEDPLDFTGIQNIISPSIVKKTLACKRRCWNAVFDEQQRQYELGEHDPDKLAFASQRHSEWAVKRAERIATMET